MSHNDPFLDAACCEIFQHIARFSYLTLLSGLRAYKLPSIINMVLVPFVPVSKFSYEYFDTLTGFHRIVTLWCSVRSWPWLLLPVPSVLDIIHIKDVLSGRKRFTIRRPSSITRRRIVRVSPIAKDSRLQPPVGVWAVSQSQCG